MNFPEVENGLLMDNYVDLSGSLGDQYASTQPGRAYDTSEAPMTSGDAVTGSESDESQKLTLTNGCTNEEETIDEEEAEQEPLSDELQQGYRILKELLSDSNKNVNWPFIWPVDSSQPETADYYEKIKNPMWLNKMKEKFENREYETITQFVSDFRLMLENCYRYNGPDHFVSKRAQKLETMMEQKLALLSRDLREKTSIEATSGIPSDDTSIVSFGSRRRTRTIVPHDSTALLNQLREQEVQRERESRRQQMLERKQQQEAYHQQMLDWEDKIMEGKGQDMKAMWELPQIGHFLFLCQEPLNIGEISQFELERCFYMPRESSSLQRVMTALLSTPFQRLKIDRKCMMPYPVWEEKLRVKSRIWYKSFTDCHYDVNKVAEKVGIDPFFFRVLGKKNPLEKKKFHELGVYRRIWLVKTLCDYCLETQESLRDNIEMQPIEEQRDYLLGVDAEGNSYLHFPQFCGADLRIYRQSYIPEPKFEKPKEETPKRKPHLSNKKDNSNTSTKKPKLTSTSSPAKKKKKINRDIPNPPTNRPSHLRQTIKTVLPVASVDDSVSDDGTTSDSDDDDNEKTDEVNEDNDDSDATVTESGTSETSPTKKTRLTNKHITRLAEIDNFSDSSSMDSDLGANFRRRSIRLMKFDDSSSVDSDLTFGRGKRRGRQVKNKVTRNYSDLGSEKEETLSEKSTKGKLYEKKTKKDLTEFTKVEEETSSEVETVDKNKTKIFESAKAEFENSESNFSSESCETSAKDGCSDCSALLEAANSPSKDADSEDHLFKFKNDSMDVKMQGDDRNFNIQSDSNKTTVELCSVGERGDNPDSQLSSYCYSDSPESNISHKTSIEIKHQEIGKNIHQKSNDDKQSDINNSKTNTLLDHVSEVVKKRPDCQLHSNLSNSFGKTMDFNSCDSLNQNDSDILLPNGNSASDDKVKRLAKDSNDLKDNLKMSLLSSSNNVINDKLKREPKEEIVSKCEISNIDDVIKTEAKTDIILDSFKTECKEELNDKTHVEEPSFPLLDDEIDYKNFPKREVECETTNENLDMKGLKKGNEIYKRESCAVGYDVPCVKMEVETDLKSEDDKEDKVEGIESKSEFMTETKTDGKSDPEKKIVREKIENAEMQKLSNEDDKKNNDEETLESDEEEGLVMGPEIGPFELIAESVEDLKELVDQFSEPDHTPVRGRKPPNRKRCVVNLHERLNFLLKELEPWEAKLLQATKKARIKLKKEQETWKEEEIAKENEISQWDSEKSDASGSETDEGNSENDNDESNSDSEPEKVPTNPSTPGAVKETSETVEWDVSLRGRIRKRRIIPNNIEQENAAKRRKVVTATVATTTSALALGMVSTAPLSTITVQRHGKVDQQKSASQILLQTSHGNQALVTGLTSQQLSNLQLVRGPGTTSLQPGQARIIQSPALQAKSSQSILKSQPRILTSKQASHPVIQQLLSSQRSTAKYEQLSKSSPSENNVRLPRPGGLENRNSSKVNTPAVSPQVSTQNTQLYAANVNSLPPAVLQQLLKTNAVKILPGTNQSSSIVLLSAVSPQGSNTGGQNISLNLTGQQTQTDIGSSQQKVLLSSEGPSGPRQALILPNQSIRHMITPQSQGNFTPQSQGNFTQKQTLILQQPTCSAVKNVVLPQVHGVLGQRAFISQQTPVSDNTTVQNHLSSQSDNVQIYKNLIPHSQDSTKLSTLLNDTNSGNSLTLLQSHVGSTNVGTTQTTDMNLGQGLNNKSVIICTGSQGDNLPQMDQSSSCSSLTALNISPKLVTGMPSPLLPPSPNRANYPVRYASNVTVKTLLEIKKEHEKSTVSPVTPVASLPVVASSKCFLSNPNLNSAINIPISAISSALPGANQSTVIIHPTSSGIKTLKLPSKAALDSAVQAVVTEVKTSLPTANIKVPSPVTMPSLQPRKNVTKTIQSMKGPIPTTIESKLNKSQLNINKSVVSLNSMATSQANNLLQNQAVKISTGNNQVPENQNPLTNVSSVDQTQKNVLLKLMQPSMQVGGQGVVQGYLTPQGIVIPQATLQQQQQQQQQTPQMKVQQKRVVINPQVVSPQNLLLQYGKVQQNMPMNQMAVLNINTGAKSSVSALSVSNPSAVISKIPSGLTESNKQSVMASSNLMKSMAALNTTCTLVTSVGEMIHAKDSSKVSVTPPSPAKTASVIAMHLNSFSGTPQVSSISPLSTLQSVTSTTMARTATRVTQPSPSVTLTTQAKASSGITLSPYSLGFAPGSNPGNYIVPQSPVQLNTQLGQIPGAVLGNPSKIATILGQGGNTDPLQKVQGTGGMKTVQSVEGLVSSAKLLEQGQLVQPSSVARTIDQSNLLSQISIQQKVGSMAANLPKVYNINAGQQASNVGGVARPTFSLQSALSSNTLLPVMSNTALKQGHIIAEQGSSSELIKQIAAAQLMNMSQVQVTSGSNLTIGNAVTEYGLTKNTPTVSVAGNQILLQLPNTASGVQQIRGQGQMMQGQTMLLLSPQQGLLSGNVGRFSTPSKQITLKVNSPVKNISVVTTSSIVPELGTGMAQVKDQLKMSTAKMQLNFDAKPVIAEGRRGIDQSKSITEHTIGTPSVHSLGPGTTALNPTSQNEQFSMNKPTENVQMAVLSSPSIQISNAPQTVSSQSSGINSSSSGGGAQKLFLYNIGGQLVTPQGVPVTVENGILKVLPKGACQIPSETIALMMKSAQQNLQNSQHKSPTSTKSISNISSPVSSSTAPLLSHTSVGTAQVKIATTSAKLLSLNEDRTASAIEGRDLLLQKQESDLNSHLIQNNVHKSTPQGTVPSLSRQALLYNAVENDHASNNGRMMDGSQFVDKSILHTEFPSSSSNVLANSQPLQTSMCSSFLDKVGSVVNHEQTISSPNRPNDASPQKVVRLKPQTSTDTKPRQLANTSDILLKQSLHCLAKNVPGGPGYIVLPNVTGKVIYPQANILSNKKGLGLPKSSNVIDSSTLAAVENSNKTIISKNNIPVGRSLSISPRNSQMGSTENIWTSVNNSMLGSEVQSFTTQTIANEKHVEQTTLVNPDSDKTQSNNFVSNNIDSKPDSSATENEGPQNDTKEVESEQEAALNLLSLANQGFGNASNE